MSRRVVITGLGPITAFGLGIDPLWTAMVEGRTAIRRIDRFHQAQLPCPFAAAMGEGEFRARDLVPKSYRKATKVMCRDIELAVGAADAAVRDAGLITKGIDPQAPPTIPPERFGCQIGAGLISADVEELTAALVTSRAPAEGEGWRFDINHWGSTGMTNLTPLWLLKYLPNMLACHVTIIHDCRGPSNTITCCEASSLLSVGESMRIIDRGSADACLTGGAEYKLNPMAFLRQSMADRLAHVEADHDPATIVRPFDPTACGTVIGEGGGLLVIEAEANARERGARIYAEIAGFACTQSLCRDATGLQNDPEDAGIAEAITGALDAAGAAPGEVDAIVPFGSSIPHVDEAEAAALHRVFGERVAAVPLITTIPNVGNCAAGNGGVAVAVAARAMHEQRLPARLNTAAARSLQADACPATDASLGTVLLTTTSQGGQNAAMVLRRSET